MSARSVRRTWRVVGSDHRLDIRVEGDRVEGTVDGTGGERKVAGEVTWSPPETVIVRAGDRVHRALVVRRADRLLVALDGETFELEPADGERAAAGPAGSEPFAVSPMTGILAKVAVAPGERVGAGAPLFVVEAMKMEFVVRAPRDLRVREVRRSAGDRVALGEVVVSFAEEP
jgi:acetyl/propionyl-CoA carboxylase alpha subunit